MTKKIALSNDICSARWTCANINKKGCNVTPLEGNDFVLCSLYKTKRAGKKHEETKETKKCPLGKTAKEDCPYDYSDICTYDYSGRCRKPKEKFKRNAEINPEGFQYGETT